MITESNNQIGIPIFTEKNPHTYEKFTNIFIMTKQFIS